jgi:hypothetical protein
MYIEFMVDCIVCLTIHEQISGKGEPKLHINQLSNTTDYYSTVFCALIQISFTLSVEDLLHTDV